MNNYTQQKNIMVVLQTTLFHFLISRSKENGTVPLQLEIVSHISRQPVNRILGDFIKQVAGTWDITW